MDDNDFVLDEATKAIFIIGVKFRQADINGKQKLRQPRDKAFSAYSIARLKLLEDEVICTPENVQDMKEIRKEIENAATVQNLITTITRLVRILIVL